MLNKFALRKSNFVSISAIRMTRVVERPFVWYVLLSPNAKYAYYTWKYVGLERIPWPMMCHRARHFSDANMIACSVVGSRLGYANAVLHGTSSKNINRLQRIQNVLARCVLDSQAIGARMRCYINYTGCPSVIVLTLNLRSSLVHLLLARNLIH